MTILNKNKFIVIFIIANFWHIQTGISQKLPLTNCNNYIESTMLLYGLWKAEMQGQGPNGKLTQTATLLFEKHPELAGSVTGVSSHNSLSDERTGAGGINDYHATSAAYVTIRPL